MTFSFNKQKAIGKKIEEFLANYAKEELEWLKGRECDFKTKFPIPKLKRPVSIEVKNDESTTAKKYFDEGKLPNFFIERYSNEEKQTDGGPHQALAKGAEVFIYVYGSKQIAYIFNTKELVKLMDKLPNKKSHSVRNPGYNTLGYIVPHEQLVGIAKYIDLNIENQKLIPIFNELF